MNATGEEVQWLLDRNATIRFEAGLPITIEFTCSDGARVSILSWNLPDALEEARLHEREHAAGSLAVCGG